MKDPILLNKLYREVDAGNVTVSYSGDLAIFKYTQDCHIKDRWNDVNRLARGIIFRMDGTIVARPFEKFFNLNERSETHPDRLPWNEGVEVYEKIDGSCGIGYRKETWDCGIGTHNRWFLATPGSMESEQAIEGTEILHERILPKESFTSIAKRCMPEDDGLGDIFPTSQPRYQLDYLPIDCTPVFEIIYPGNRVVVDYQGYRGLVLLTIFEHNGIEWHPRCVDQIAEVCGFRRPRRYDIDLRSEISFEDNSEGYVARFGNGFRVKVKSPTYLRIHRLLNHLSPKGVVELIRGKEYGAVVKQLPASIARDFDDVRAHVQGIYNSVFTDAHEYLRRINKFTEILSYNDPVRVRKTQAQWIIENVPNAETGFVFALLDGKDIEDKVWKFVLERVRDEAGPRTAKVV